MNKTVFDPFRYLTGLIVALVAVCCVLIAVIGVIAYRVSMRSVVWKNNWSFGIDIGSKVQTPS